MKKNITIKDVAAYTGLSVGTVSMALNNSEKIAPKTKEIVAKAVAELGFRKNPFGKFLSTKTSKTIGCIVPDITNQFYGEMVAFLQQELEKRDYGLVIGFANENSVQESKLITQFIDRGVDGIISVPVADSKHDISQIKQLYEEDFPIVFIAAYYKDLPYYTVMADLEDGMYQLTKEFLNRGYRNIVCVVGDEELVPTGDRIKGFKKAFQDAGVELKHNSMIKANNVTYIGGYSAIVNEMFSRESPEVIFTINDIMAMGVINALRTRGKHIPEDIRVAGFDDISMASYLETPLTTVNQSVKEMCKQTVELLMQRINGETPDKGIRKIPTSVVIRASAY